MRISDWSSDVCSSDLRRCFDFLASNADARLQVNDWPEQSGQDGKRDKAPEFGSAWHERPALGKINASRQLAPRLRQLDDRQGFRQDSEGQRVEEYRMSIRLPPVTNAHFVCRLMFEKK